MLSDLLVTGHLFWSLTNTRHTASELGRKTGIADVPQYIPRRLGEILGPFVLLAAALGGVLGLLWLRTRVLLGAIVGVLAVGVFAVFASAGLPINTRYAFLGAAILCVFAGGGVFGWQRLPAGDLAAALVVGRWGGFGFAAFSQRACAVPLASTANSPASGVSRAFRTNSLRLSIRTSFLCAVPALSVCPITGLFRCCLAPRC